MRLQRDSYAPKSCAFDAANVQFLRAHLCKSHPVLQQEAHEHLDRAVDQLYRTKPFENDEDRLQMLFEKYGKLVESTRVETAKKGKIK